MTFAERLKQLREQVGMTQRKLVEVSGLGLSTITQYEQGWREPTLGTAKKLAAALGVDVNALANYDTEMAEMEKEPPKSTKPKAPRSKPKKK